MSVSESQKKHVVKRVQRNHKNKLVELLKQLDNFIIDTNDLVNTLKKNYKVLFFRIYVTFTSSIYSAPVGL